MSTAPEDPKIVATPEGDNEFAPDQPLKLSEPLLDGLQTPPGSESTGTETADYKADRSSEKK
jgi:hypothetical protein